MDKEQEQFEIYKELIEARILNKNLQQANQQLCEKLGEEIAKTKKIESKLKKIEDICIYED